MATANVQAIAGVSPGSENEIMSVFPSVGSTGLGRWIGRLCESMPLGKSPVKLSHLLFALPLSPLGALIYVWLKLTGHRFLLTNRGVVIKAVVGQREVTRVNLTDIADVVVQQFDGQHFFRCADIALIGSNGKTIRQLPGVPRADIFRETIVKARDAAVQVKASLDTINARHSG